MRLLPLLMFWISATSVLAENIRLPKPGPTALEKFINHRHTQIVRVYETARFGSNDEWIKVTALVARNRQTHPSEMRGIWFVVSSIDAVDNVYLPLTRALAFRNRLTRLQETLQYIHDRGRHLTILGTEDCAPSQAQYRIHELCAGIYQRNEESGLIISTGSNTPLFLADVEPAELIDSIDSALVALEYP